MLTIVHKKGNTFPGATFDYRELTNETFTLVGASLKMELRQVAKPETLVSGNYTDGIHPNSALYKILSDVAITEINSLMI